MQYTILFSQRIKLFVSTTIAVLLAQPPFGQPPYGAAPKETYLAVRTHNLNTAHLDSTNSFGQSPRTRQVIRKGGVKEVD